MKLVKKAYRIVTEDQIKKEIVIKVPLSEISQCDNVVKRAIELTDKGYDNKNIIDHLMKKEILKAENAVIALPKIEGGRVAPESYLDFLIDWIYVFKPHWRIKKDPVVILNRIVI